MKIISLLQPWAQLVATGEKTIDPWGWPTDYRGPLAIHASRGQHAINVAWLPHYRAALKPYFVEGEKGPELKLEYGAIIAICRLHLCVKITQDFVDKLPAQERAFGDFSLGRYAWIYKDIQPLKKPVPTKGRRGLWNYYPAAVYCPACNANYEQELLQAAEMQGCPKCGAMGAQIYAQMETV